MSEPEPSPDGTFDAIMEIVDQNQTYRDNVDTDYAENMFEIPCIHGRAHVLEVPTGGKAFFTFAFAYGYDSLRLTAGGHPTEEDFMRPRDPACNSVWVFDFVTTPAAKHKPAVLAVGKYLFENGHVEIGDRIIYHRSREDSDLSRLGFTRIPANIGD